MRWVRYWYTLTESVGALWYILSQYALRKRWVEQALPPLAAHERRRLRQYLPVFLLIEYLYARLRGKALDREMRYRATLLAALTPFFDDLTDLSDYSSGQIHRLVQGSTEHDLPAARYCAALFQAGGFQWSAAWERVVQAQLSSRQQTQTGLSEAQLMQLTAEKGGASVVLGWEVIAGKEGGDAVRQLSESFGYFAQLLNDIFDVWKDLQAGIHTLATDAPALSVIAHRYHDAFDKLTQDLSATPWRRSGQQRILALLVVLYALGATALHRWRAAPPPFSPQQYSRRQLVCDMAQWSNRLYWAWEILRRPASHGANREE